MLTAKTLQQEMAAAVLELLNEQGSFRSLRLRAKAKMCANEELICHEEYCRFARDYYIKLQSTGILGRLLDGRPDLDPDRIHAAAREEELCPFELSLQLAERVHVVVCDYNYVFDPYVALAEFGADNDLSQDDSRSRRDPQSGGARSGLLQSQALRRGGARSLRGHGERWRGRAQGNRLPLPAARKPSWSRR